MGSAIFFDYFGVQLNRRIKQVKLIEPTVALRRAKAVVDCYLGDPRADTLNKTIDELTPEDTRTNSGLPVVHLLSNVLDIDGFNHRHLFSKIFGTLGKHTVLAVSHDRDFYGGSNRFEELDQAVQDLKRSQWLKIESSIIQRYTCGSNKPSISWELRIEVLSGSV